MKPTLIIPCAGKSSRFPNMKPKWLLTHPDGHLMIEKCLSGFDLQSFSKIVITIVRKHDVDYNAIYVLKQVFNNYKNINIEYCVLGDFTNSASETIFETITKLGIQGPIVIKDSDNYVSFDFNFCRDNAIVGLDLKRNTNVNNILGKSFLVVKNGVIVDIVEKQIVSDEICLGVYVFKDSTEFVDAYKKIIKQGYNGELYLSHVISFMMSSNNQIFLLIEAKDYKDWGTFNEWKIEQIKSSTYFIDFDGVLIKNSGKYGLINWSNNEEMIESNCKKVAELVKAGAQLVITTARGAEFEPFIRQKLSMFGITPLYILTGLNHAPRVLVNDFAPTNPYPSAKAISIPRDSSLRDYL